MPIGTAPTATTPADAELVAATRAGSRDAFGAIYDRYADRLHDFCHSVLRDRHEAADATQDTFVIAARRIGQLRDPDKLRPWLFAIARHEALRRARARRRAVPTADLGATDTRDSGADDDTGAEATVTADALRAVVWDAAAGLSDRDRVLLDLHLRQGLDGQALADAIGTSPGHAYVLMNRLRAQVERSLGALLVARAGRDDCPQLQEVLRDWDGRFSPLWRKRVARHVDGCTVCSKTRAALASPWALLGATPLLPAPAALREQVLGHVDLASSARRSPLASARHGFPRSMFPLRRLRVPIVAALVTALALGIGFLATRSSDRPEPRVVAGAPGGNAAVEPTPSTGAAVVPPTVDASTTTTTTPATTSTSEVAPVAPPPPPPDSVGPVISGLSTDHGCIYSTVYGGSPDTTTARAAVTDPSGVASVTLEYSLGGSGSRAMAASGGEHTASLGPFSLEGSVSWRVVATDAAGNTATASGPPVQVANTYCPY